ncbi:hypothetical protein ACH5RR_021226 [Cinchona calisaya]|uniref:Uncharacterized protein n=1 Tax=Cinchona calisaya TaxID=153742 RepID=A0ABD2ZGQ2_9GENT
MLVSSSSKKEMLVSNTRKEALASKSSKEILASSSSKEMLATISNKWSRIMLISNNNMCNNSSSRWRTMMISSRNRLLLISNNGWLRIFLEKGPPDATIHKRVTRNKKNLTDANKVMIYLNATYLGKESPYKVGIWLKNVGRAKGKNKLPFELEMEKILTIPDQELKAWNSWYNEKKRSNPNFEREFQEAIKRERPGEELIYETTLEFRGATKSSIQELEVVKLDYLSLRSSCSICLEELEKGFQAI